MYKTILADPPWEMGKMGSGRDKRFGRKAPIGGAILTTPYPTMTIDEIARLPIGDLADIDCHLWLWTTNRQLHNAFHIMDKWGFHYLNTVTWIKPNGVGAYFINRTQFVLFGYREKCIFSNKRYLPNVIFDRTPSRHSQKPEKTYTYIESVSSPPRLELFARCKRAGWDAWGNEVESDITL